MWIVGYYAKGHRPRRDETTGGVVLEYPTSFKVMSLTLLIAGCGMVLIPLVVIGIKEPEDPYICAALFLFFAGVGGGSTLESFRTEIIVSDSGLSHRSYWSRPRVLLWEEMICMGYNRWMCWFKAVDRSGKVIRIPLHLGGMDAFEKAVRRHLRPTVYRDAEEGFAIAKKGVY